TENVAGIVGLAKALQLASEGHAEEATQIAAIRAHMKQRLQEAVPGVAFNGHPDDSLYAVLNVSFPPSEHNDMLVMSLDIAGISASGGSACSSGAETQSHVLEAIGHPADRKAVRFSFSRYTTKADIDLAVSQLAAIFAGEVPVMA